MKEKLKIIKIGGKLIDNQEKLSIFLRDFSAINEKKILVHGGGTIVNKLADRLNIKTCMYEGRRITDKDNLELSVMVYAGLLNKQIVAGLQKFHCNAIGLSGADASCIQSVKRAVKEIDYGFAGDITHINSDIISNFIHLKLVPVFSAVTHDNKGQLLNTNADTVAAEIAMAMAGKYEVSLYYLFEKNGVIVEPVQERVAELINTKLYEELIEKKVITEGMIPKLANCFLALNHSVKEVFIGNEFYFSNNGQEATKVIL